MSDAELRDELRAVARDLLGSSRTDAGAPATPGWPALADAGWLGLEVTEDLGGSGATFAETAVVIEELARSAARTPFLGAVALGVGLLDLLEPSDVRDGLLRMVAAGEVRVAVAVRSDEGFDPAFAVTGSHVTGRAEFVADAGQATRLLLVAKDEEETPVVVRVAAEELAITAQPVLDETRRFATVAADAVPVDPASVLRFQGDPFTALRRMRSRAAVAIAADALGVAEAMLAATVAYAKVRHQFDRAIGSFQAVKHQCADMLVAVTVGRELLDAAVDALVADDSDAPRAAARAKAYLGDAAVDVAGKAMQLHGGIGYTWESGVHLYLKRAMLDRALFGSPTTHRRRLAQRWI
ncbi:MAG TPA: acyl-CoA dehydrogenase family protein [Mycobacteriales bacterium]|nr:acyl-CoA dehydrogenase family protein [Mycobacteriales bacterium]